MSKMAELSYDIEQLYIEGMSPKTMAREVNRAVEIVNEWIKANSLYEGEDAYDPYDTINS